MISLRILLLLFFLSIINAQIALPTFQAVHKPHTAEASSLYDFTTHTFTNCGATGREGPTLANCKSSYDVSWEDNTDYFNVTNGIQYWTVPETGTYTIEVWGARGGYSGYNTSVYGKGTKMKSDHNLTKGEIIKILIGQPGSVNSATNYQYNSSGGGGSFVWKSGASSPLVVAGGGGGGSKEKSQHSNLDANVGESGKGGINSGSGTQSNGGSNGSGGSGSSYSWQAAAGGGWLSDGGGGHSYCNYAVSGGKGINNNGGAGGEGGNEQGGGTNYLGGFGGGGGATGACGSSGSGGGGGYSGGGVGSGCCYAMGGGGGSYNTGSNNYSSTSLGYNTGDGKVIIQKISN